MKSKTKKGLYLFSILIILFVSLIGFLSIQTSILPDEFYASFDEIENANTESKLGSVKIHFDKGDFHTINETDEQDGFVVYKLFGFIPIKKAKVKILPEEDVYIGGETIGLTVNTDGALIISNSTVDASLSKISKNKHLKNGDIIQGINGQNIKSIENLNEIVQNIEEDEIEIEYLRNNTLRTEKIKLIKNSEGKYKLGVWVKDDISGIGTLSFVKKDKSFAALGHAVTNGDDENTIPITNGNVYSCSMLGIVKGEKNKPGELKCYFVEKDEKGEITKNSKYGIYGKLNNTDDLVDNNLSMKIGGRFSVKPGKAYIMSSISGIQEEYEIEIIKANYQTHNDDKSIVFRVTDKRLLDLTGGIVQGMSGSPIIQNNKIVGAVTHVFISDPTKGYGVYCDWMLEQM